MIILTSLIISKANAQSLDPLWDSLLESYQFSNNLQSYCYTNSENKIKGHRINQRVRPASVTKLYVSLWALEKMGPNYTYKTQIITDGINLHIIGAHDSFFVAENIFLLISQLNKMGISSINKLTFSDNFYFNWSSDKKQIETLLYKYLNTDKWNEKISREFQQTINSNRDLNLGLEINTNINLSVSKIEANSTSPFNLKNNTTTIVFESSPLHYHLKEMNIYSNNFISQKIFDLNGGTNMFSQYLLDTFDVTSQNAYFYTGSGLSDNYTTCALTIKIIDRLQKIIANNNLKNSDILSVPGSDSGTLHNRFTEQSYNKSLWAKTGTLRQTSTLSGLLSTNNGIKLFGVFNHTDKIAAARNFQDEFIKKMIDFFGGSQFFNYSNKPYSPLKKSKIRIYWQKKWPRKEAILSME